MGHVADLPHISKGQSNAKKKPYDKKQHDLASHGIGEARIVAAEYPEES